MARRPKWIKYQKTLEVGSVVWILEDMIPRGIWPVGIVEMLSYSNVGKVSSCEIRTGFGKQTRPVNKLALVIDATKKRITTSKQDTNLINSNHVHKF